MQLPQPTTSVQRTRADDGRTVTCDKDGLVLEVYEQALGAVRGADMLSNFRFT